MKCHHPKSKIKSEDWGFESPIGPPFNPRAHGNICIHETCLRCGAIRKTNSNAGSIETTGWFQKEIIIHD